MELHFLQFYAILEPRLTGSSRSALTRLGEGSKGYVERRDGANKGFCK